MTMHDPRDKALQYENTKVQSYIPSVEKMGALNQMNQNPVRTSYDNNENEFVESYVVMDAAKMTPSLS